MSDTNINTNTQNSLSVHTVLCALLAILLPPLGTFLKIGFAGHFWLNILLTLFGYIPGIIHAIWIIVRTEQENSATPAPKT